MAILLHPEQWSFAVFVPGEADSAFFVGNKTAARDNVFASFKDRFFANDFFSLPFQDVFVINHSPDFTFIPDSIDAGRFGKEFLTYLSSERGGAVLHHTVEGMGFQVVHRLPEAVYDFFSRSFANTRFIHHSAPQIRYFAAKDCNAGEKRMCVTLQGREMDVFCFDGGKLLLANTYTIRDRQDILYFISFTWKQLGLNQLTDPVLLAGNNTESKAVLQDLSRYIRNVEQCPMPNFCPACPYPVLEFFAVLF
jgi:hypothetical protein